MVGPKSTKVKPICPPGAALTSIIPGILPAGFPPGGRKGRLIFQDFSDGFWYPGAMRRLCAHLSAEEADDYALVLSSAGLTCFQVKNDSSGWSLWVAESAFETALRSLEKYGAENPGRTPPETPPPPPVGQKTTSGVWVSLLLLASFLATGSDEAFRSLAGLCGASAKDILNGDLYRTATALMLHATPAHLAGNIVGIALFGTAVCRITGAGVGWLTILLTGIVGNLLNAFLFRSGHLSVGASTAVFGAVGILSAYQFHQKRSLPEKRIKSWLPLAGGLALLGLLGAGRHSDLTAHLFGFAAGLMAGLIYARSVKRPLGSRYQVWCLTAAVVILAGSWFWAYFQR